MLVTTLSIPADVVVRDRMAPGDSLERREKHWVLIAFLLVGLVSLSVVHGVILRVISSCRSREPMSDREASLPYPKVKPGVTLEQTELWLAICIHNV